MTKKLLSFWQNTALDPVTGCLEWTGRLASHGYGLYGAQGYAHRIAFKKYNGYDAINFVCHTCDNRKCIAEQHLYDGTPKNNSQDAARQGKMGRRNNLSWNERNLVRLAIQDGKLTQREIGAVFRVSQATVRECKDFLHETKL